MRLLRVTRRLIGFILVGFAFGEPGPLHQMEFKATEKNWGKPYFESSTQNIPAPIMESGWIAESSFTLKSELPDQQAGIVIGSAENQIRLVVGRLMVTQGIAFNVALYKRGQATQYSPLKTFHSGDLIHFRILKRGKSLWAFYSLDGKDYNLAGYIEEGLGNESAPVGVCFIDENRFHYEKRVRQSAVEFTQAKFRSFSIQPLGKEKGIPISIPRIYARLKLIQLPQDQSTVKIACTLMEFQHERLYRFALNRNGTLKTLPTGVNQPMLWSQFSAADQFSKGETTPWIDLSPYFSNTRLQTVMAWSFCHGTQAVDQGEDSGDLKSYRIQVDFSTKADETAIVSQIIEQAQFHRLALFIPTNEGESRLWMKGIRSLTQYSRDIVAAYQKAGIYSLAEQSRKSAFLFQGSFHDGAYLFGRLLDPEAIEHFIQVGEFLGYNSNEYYLWPPWHSQFGSGQVDSLVRDIWRSDLAESFRLFLNRDHAHFSEGLNGIRLEGRMRPYALPDWKKDRPTFVKVGDEPHVFGPDILKQSPEGIKQLRHYLKQIHTDSKYWGKNEWDQIKPLEKKEVKNREDGNLFYYQAYFLQKTFSQMHRVYSGEIRNRFGSGVATGTANYWAGFNISPDYFIESKERAFDIAMHHYGSGDTIGPRQTNADLWMADMLRSASKFGEIKQGILWFLCRIADETAGRLSGITAIGRENQNIHFYGYGPRWTAWEWFVDDQWKIGTFHAAHDTVRMMLDFEPVLKKGKKPPVEVAIGLSRGTSIWANIESDQMVQIFGYSHEKGKRKGSGVLSIPAEGWALERRMIHNALQWKSVSTDVLPEEEIEADRIKNYRVIYWTDPHLSQSGRLALEEWIQGGGVLFLGPQAATRDESNQISPWIDRISGGEAKVVLERQEKDRVFKKWGGYQELWETTSQYDQEDVESLTVLDHMRTTTGELLEVLGTQESIVFPRATVIANYSNQKPAWVKWSYGKGTIYKIGTSLGALYAKSANPHYSARKGDESAPHTFINSASTAFTQKSLSPVIQDMILRPVTEASLSLPISSSVRGIDTKLFEDDEEAALFLGKWTNQSTEKTEIRVTLHKRYATVSLWSQSPISVRWEGTTAYLQFHLGTTDVVHFRESKLKPN